MKISAILLGAGESKRMGKDKLALPWGKRTMLEHCAQTLLRSKVDEVLLIVNEKTERIARHLNDRRMKVILNPHFRKGMSSSIRWGMKNLNPQSKGILIALADQPFLKAKTVNALVETFRKKKKIIVPSFNGKRGHPVIFPRTYEKELLRLRGDEGGRSILQKHPEEVHFIPVKSVGVLRDIDTWEDYQRELGVKS